MRAVLIAAIAVVILIIGGFLILANFSAVPREYVCEGETREADGTAQEDTGRLRVEDYRWWVRLWSDSRGMAIFDSKKIARFVSLKLDKIGRGNFSVYMGLDPGRQFVFRRATGEVGIRATSQQNEHFYTFTGECKEAPVALFAYKIMAV
jgi:hypothetical protein